MINLFFVRIWVLLCTKQENLCVVYCALCVYVVHSLIVMVIYHIRIACICYITLIIKQIYLSKLIICGEMKKNPASMKQG